VEQLDRHTGKFDSTYSYCNQPSTSHLSPHSTPQQQRRWHREVLITQTPPFSASRSFPAEHRRGALQNKDRTPSTTTWLSLTKNGPVPHRRMMRQAKGSQMKRWMSKRSMVTPAFSPLRLPYRSCRQSHLCSRNFGVCIGGLAHVAPASFCFVLSFQEIRLFLPELPEDHTTDVSQTSSPLYLIPNIHIPWAS